MSSMSGKARRETTSTMLTARDDLSSTTRSTDTPYHRGRDRAGPARDAFRTTCVNPATQRRTAPLIPPPPCRRRTTQAWELIAIESG